MAAGFVHGVLNTDNMVVTGESFDYGPWRFLPYSDPSFTAAYFDETKLYAFGRQPSAVLWNLSQFANCLTLLAEPADLERELATYELAYREAFPRRVLGVLGLKPAGADQAVELMKALFGWMGQTHATWPQVFFDWFGGEASLERLHVAAKHGVRVAGCCRLLGRRLGRLRRLCQDGCVNERIYAGWHFTQVPEVGMPTDNRFGQVICNRHRLNGARLRDVGNTHARHVQLVHCSLAVRQHAQRRSSLYPLRRAPAHRKAA
jgi:hypothetical protein